MKRQRRLFTNFCNAKLCDRDDVPPITDVFEDLRDPGVCSRRRAGRRRVS